MLTKRPSPLALPLALAPLALVLLAVALVYSNSFANEFHFDDFHTITDNPAVRSLGNLRRIFTDTTAFSVLPANQTYRPIVTASLALDYALGHGYVPFWFHLSTFVWFLVLIAVLFLFVQVLLDRVEVCAANRWLALGVAAWFGLHPAMAETVNYIIQRGDLYCTLGCVAALWVFARWPGLRRFGLYLAPFVVAMLSKPPAAVFPLLLALYIFLFETPTEPPLQRWRRSFVAALPAAAVTGLLLLLQARMTPKTFLPSIVSPTAYRLTQPYVWLRYVAALFLPLHLNVDTDLQPIASLDLAAWAGLLFVFGLGAVTVYAARRRRGAPVAFGLGWFVLTQVPTSLYPLSEVENDHRMFFSFPGLMLAVVWGLYLGYERLLAAAQGSARQRQRLRAAAFASALLCLGGYAYGAHRRNQVWRTEATLWADDVAKSPHNGRGLMIYGLTRMNAGDLGGALALFHRALAFTPNYPTLEINLGVVNGLLAQADPARKQEAEQHFLRALALAPADDLPHAYYGRWLLTEGRLPEATAQLETAVALNPQRPLGRNLLLSAQNEAGKGAAALMNASLAAYRAGHFQQSIDLAKQALAADPHSAEAWNNVGAGYGALGQWSEGIAAEQEALRLHPHLEIAENNLRWFLRQKTLEEGKLPQVSPRTVADYINLSLTLNQQGRFPESIAAAKRALVIDPKAAEAWNNIAAGDEALHRWDDAIVAAQKALALRPDFELAKNNLAWAVRQKEAAQGR